MPTFTWYGPHVLGGDGHRAHHPLLVHVHAGEDGRVVRHAHPSSSTVTALVTSFCSTMLCVWLYTFA
jgi:hypothetical protein